jgi:hypothetical protein
MGTWWAREFVGTVVYFAHPPVPRMRPVCADASTLPFRAGSFDLVACVDVFQELDFDLIPRVCAEMARVARREVVVVSPCGADAEECDRYLLEWCERKGIPAPEWLPRQVARGLPDPDAIHETLAELGSVRRKPNTSAAWHSRLFRTEELLRRGRLMTVIQPLLRAWGRLVPSELPGRPPYYRMSFSLEIQATHSPPRDLS